MQFSYELPHISFLGIIFSSLILLVVKIRNITTIFMPKNLKPLKELSKKYLKIILENILLLLQLLLAAGHVGLLAHWEFVRKKIFVIS